MSTITSVPIEEEPKNPNRLFRTVRVYLTACWPAPAALHTSSRIFTGTRWLRYSEERVPDEGNLGPSGPVEYGDDGRLWWNPGRGERQVHM